jgi:hypothetical protein
MPLPAKSVESTDNIIELKRSNKELQLQMQEEALQLVHNSLADAVAVLIDGLDDEDPYIRIRCAEDILRKVLPDKKTKEVTGKGGGPIEIEETDKRAAVLTIVGVLDELGFDELRERASGSQRIFEAEFKTEDKEKRRIPETEKADQGRERSGSDQSPGESSEGIVSAEEGPGDESLDGRGEEDLISSRRREEY